MKVPFWLWGYSQNSVCAMSVILGLSAGYIDSVWQ
jgi:hypothetical protein